MSAEQTIDAATLSDAASVPAPEGVIAEAEEKPVEATTAPAETAAAEEPKPEAKSTEAKPTRVKRAKAKHPARPGFRTVLIMGYGVLVPLVAMAMVVVLTYPANGVANVLKVEITYAAALLARRCRNAAASLRVADTLHVAARRARHADGRLSGNRPGGTRGRRNNARA